MQRTFAIPSGLEDTDKSWITFMGVSFFNWMVRDVVDRRIEAIDALQAALLHVLRDLHADARANAKHVTRLNLRCGELVASG